MIDLTMFRAVPREGGEMNENTPTPWKQGTDSGHNAVNIFDANGTAVCQVYGIPLNTRVCDVPERFSDGMATAALIVRAVNSHAALRAALSKIADEAEEFSHGDQNAQSIVRGLAAIARRALTEA